MIGSAIGSYTIVRELGAGGMGTVYLAEAPEGRRRVAVKIVHPHLIATPGFFKRFMREGELGRKVVHENVVRTLDVDATMVEDRQINYMVMEYVEGKSLRDLLNELQTIPETLLREIALQTAAGLAAIHDHDIVHRDLKPENVLVTDDNEIRIMDLGVAKLQEASIAITKEGQFAGSVLYAAPEQFRKDDEVGPAADLYSLGVLLFELATGQNPFRSDDVAAVITAHLNDEPPRAHERNPDLSLFFSELLATLLVKQPADRFESAAALHGVLEEAERSAWWVERAPKLQEQAAALPRIRVNRETNLYGRAKDLSLLRELYERATAGKGSTVLLEGEAGIGKTRLVDAFLRDIDDAHVLYGSYPPSGGLGGFSDAILDKFGEAALAESLAPYLTVTPSLVPAFAALVKHEAPPSGSDPLTGDALQAVTVHLMRALAAEKPLVWIVDDLHFAPDESHGLLLALARAAGDQRVLLIATARPGVDLAAFSRLDSFRRHEMGRLSPREVVHLLQDAFRSEMLAEKLGGRIALKSDGVPFFVFEMIRGLKEGQFITQGPDGTYVQTQVVDEIEVPSAVKDLIEARLKDLDDEDRNILDVAAVQGMAFDADLVARVLEEKRVKIMQRLAAIERRSGVVNAEGGGYRFDQNQIQEVLYHAQAPDLRREYHTLLAEARAERGDADDVFLVHHHLRSSRPSEALPHLEPALKRLEKSNRNETLLDLAGRALEIDGLLQGRERVDVLLKKAGRLEMAGRRDEQRAAIDDAVAVADETGDDALRGKAQRALGMLHKLTSQHDAADTALRGALELARAAGDRKLEAEVTGNLGVVFYDRARYAEAQEQLERARTLFREIGDREGEAGSIGNLGLLHVNHGRTAEAREHFERVLALAREIGNGRFEAAAIGNLGTIFRGLGRFAGALEHFERQRALCREIGYRQGEAFGIGNLGVVLAEVGRLGEAREQLERALTLFREIGDRQGEGIATGNMGDILCLIGRATEAREHYGRQRAIAREIGDRRSESACLLHLAAVAENAGGLDEAGRLCEESLALSRELGAGDRTVGSLIALGRIEAARGNTDAAVERLDEALALMPAAESPGILLSATVERARLPDGDVEAALAALVEHEERVGHQTRMRARFRLWQVTNDAAHLEEAKRLLDHLVEHAPEEDRESMIENVPLHREIRDAR